MDGRSLRATILMVGTLGLHGQSEDVLLFQRYRSLEGLVARARVAVEARQYGEAHLVLDRCLRSQPDHPEAQFLLARLAYEAKDYGGTLAHLHEAHLGLARLRRHHQALMDYLKARMDAEEQAARSNLEAVASRVTDPTSCVAPYLAALEREVVAAQGRKGPLHMTENPFQVPADHFFLKGNALLQLGRRQEAEGAYRAAIALDGSHAHAWNNLVALHLGAGAREEARRVLKEGQAAGVSLSPALVAAVLGTRRP